MKNVIEIKNLSKTFNTLDGQVNVLDNMSFNIKSEEIIAIIGPSGCGKSTFLNILSGIDKNYEGTIAKDKNIVISYMFQEDGLLEYESVFNNAILGLKIKKINTKENQQYVTSLIEKYGLKEFINKKVSSLSGGMKKRVALIRALAIKPDLLLLDEAFSSLDAQTRTNIEEDVFNILRNDKTTLLMITHDINEAINLADRIIVFSKRPAQIKSDFKLDKDKNTSFYFDRIWEDLNG